MYIYLFHISMNVITLIYFGLLKCVNKQHTSIGSASAITDISCTGIFSLEVKIRITTQEYYLTLGTIYILFS